MKQHLINRKLDQLCNRIDELCEGLSVCTDPNLNYNLQVSISLLIEEQAELAQQLNKLAETKQ